MAKYCKKCQCPVNTIDSDLCLFCKGEDINNGKNKEKILESKGEK